MQALSDYLKDNKITQREFSKRIFISHEYLCRIIGGHDKPSARLAKLIEHETGGVVKIAS